jgi:putative membrane protein (TIGR04086 family)
MDYPLKEILRNFLSVVVGVIIALVIIIPIAIFAALLVFSDGTVPKSQQVISTVLTIGAIAAGCFTGGYLTVKISTRKDWIHAIITGLVLTFLLALVNDFEFDWRYPDIGISYFGILPAVLIGAWAGIRKKKVISNTNSSPPGTP